MKRAHSPLLLVVFACFSLSASAQAPCSQGQSFRGCKACRTAKSKKGQTLNVQKNRGAKATHPHEVTIAEIRDPANNTGKFDPNQRVWVRAFVASIVPDTLRNEPRRDSEPRTTNRLVTVWKRTQNSSSKEGAGSIVGWPFPTDSKDALADDHSTVLAAA
jgi:hypothetical protein